MLSRFARLAIAIGHARARFLIVACGMVIGLALAGTVWWLIDDLREDHLDHARQDLGNLSLVVADGLDWGIQSVDLLQMQLLDDIERRGIDSPQGFRQQMSSAEIHQDLAHRIARLPHIAALSLHDAEGRLINFSRSWPAPEIDVRDRDFIADLMVPNAPKTAISRPQRSLTTGKWTIYFSRRIESPDGQLIGIVLCTIFTDYFERLFAQLSTDYDRDGLSDNSFTIYRDDGTLLIRYPHLDNRIGESFARAQNYNRIVASLGGSPIRLTSTLDGVDRVISAHRVLHYPLIATATDKVDAILATWRNEAWVIGSVSLALELVLAGTVLLAVRHLRSYQLIEAAEAARAKAEERERAAHAMHEQNQRFDMALNNMLQGLSMFDADNRLLVSNRRLHRMFGLPDGALTRGMTYEETAATVVAAGQVSADDMERARARRMELVKHRERTTALWEWDNGRAFTMTHQPMQSGWLTTFEEITERRSAEARLAHIAHHDPLTDLPNRVLFRLKLEAAVSQARPGSGLALFCLDLDQFKTVNDTLGHPIGDALLQAVAERLAQETRDTDTTARLGGDEFAIVQPLLRRTTEATGFAARLLEAVRTPFDIDGHRIVIGASIGIAFAPHDGTDPDHLLRAADLALYRAKADGRGVYRLFHAEMDAQIQARRALELDLRQALQTDEIEVHYQPVVSVRDRAVAGFEALARWQHPERGFVPPGEFISVAEEIGLIGTLGERVLRKACVDAFEWPGSPIVAVNISPIQFRSRDLIGVVARALRSSGLDPGRLELEITETVMLEDTEDTLATLHRLRKLGVRVAMDDFGTGYSSLGYLLRFPFDRIKIDQSFVRELGKRPDCNAVVRAAVGLSRDLGMATTAEGVETRDQFDALAAIGCSEMQGYLFSPAVPAKQVPALATQIAAMLARPAAVLETVTG